MSLPFSFIFGFKYGVPTIFFVVMLLNVFFLKLRVKPYIQRDPSLENGYNLLIAGLIIAYILPFMALVIGLAFGNYNTIYDILQNMMTTRRDPFVIAFFAIEFVEIIIYFIWVWFLGGAAFIEKHPGLMRDNTRYSAAYIKFIAVILVIMAIAMIGFFVYFQGPILPFPTK